nr:MAG TPA: hypothetical protein [Caudoviricetes sp.]
MKIVWNSINPWRVIMNDLILPEILKHPFALRKDVQVIDHVSFLLSQVSVDIVKNLIQKEFGLDINPFKPYSVTVCYSKNRLNIYPFTLLSFEFTEFYTIDPTTLPILNKVSIKTIKDVNGIPIDVLVIDSIKEAEFKTIHNKYISQYTAEWSQGEYIPYIEVCRPSVLNLEQERVLSNDPHVYLAFDTVRYMRFGEIIK